MFIIHYFISIMCFYYTIFPNIQKQKILYFHGFLPCFPAQIPLKTKEPARHKPDWSFIIFNYLTSLNI